MRLFEQWNGLSRFAAAEEHDALHLHRFAIARVLGYRTGEGCVCRLDLALLVECYPAHPLHAGGFRLLLSKRIQGFQSVIEPSCIQKLLRFCGRRSRGSDGNGGSLRGQAGH